MGKKMIILTYKNQSHEYKSMLKVRSRLAKEALMGYSERAHIFLEQFSNWKVMQQYSMSGQQYFSSLVPISTAVTPLFTVSLQRRKLGFCASVVAAVKILQNRHHIRQRLLLFSLIPRQDVRKKVPLLSDDTPASTQTVHAAELQVPLAETLLNSMPQMANQFSLTQ